MDLDTLIQLHNKGKYRILIAECEKLIRLRDQKPEVINLLGIAYKNLKCPDEALKVFQRGINEYPLSGVIWGNLGNLYLQQGKLEEAKKTLEKAITEALVDLSKTVSISVSIGRTESGY